MLKNFVATTLEDFYQLPEDVTEIVQIILTLLASDLSIGKSTVDWKIFLPATHVFYQLPDDVRDCTDHLHSPRIRSDLSTGRRTVEWKIFLSVTPEVFYQLPEDVLGFVQIILTLLASDLSSGRKLWSETSYSCYFLPVARGRHTTCTHYPHSAGL